MDAGTRGAIIFGVVLLASVAFLVVRRLRFRTGRGDLRPVTSDPRAQGVLREVKKGNAAALLAFIDALGEDWDGRDFYLAELVPYCKRQSVDSLCTSRPVPLAFLIRGCHGIHWAWEARGRGAATTVSPRARALYEERLRSAEADLLRAAQGDPRDPTPYARLITIARATHPAPETVWSFLSQALARQPDHFGAHKAMLSFLSRRWGGSAEAMLRFARERAAAAPPGSDLPMLVLEAHLDVWSDMLSFGDGPRAAQAYLGSPQVRQDVYGWYARSLGGPLQPRHNTVHYRNSAAMFFSLVQDVGAARQELQRIGKAFTEYPWVYLREGDQETIDVIAATKAVCGLR